ncbi:unnamed protein product [Heterobilharzia americana]|nr:unnamed protein product [Heterobilharzia americana]
MKFIHGNSNECDAASVFGRDIPGCVNMNVTPGSKTVNLVPYAVRRFQDPESSAVIWWSKHGAVAKTIACGEMFKRLVSKAVGLASESNEPINQPKVFQCSRLYLQFCNCSVADTAITCTLEEPAIAILFSKSPLLEEDSQLPADFGGNSFENFLNNGKTMGLNTDYRPSRRRLSVTTRKKRDTVRQFSRQHESVNNNSLEDVDLPSVPNQTPRLAPALSNVNKVLKHKNLERKRKRQSQS